MRVLKPGLYTTVQDLGRPGWRKDGVAEGGAMDRYAHRVANLLVGNDAGAATLELTLAGPELRLERDLLLAVCGADMPPSIDGEPLPLWRPFWARAGAVLAFGTAASGCRAYLAAGGGFAAEAALGSRATDARAGIGGIAGRPLRAGDALPCGDEPPRAAAWLAALAARTAADPPGRRRNWAAPRWAAPPLAYGGATAAGIELRVMPGAEYGQFREAARTALTRERYRAAPASDRMGVRLDGPPLERSGSAELLSHGVVAGTVQVPAGGTPIILAADCQTTGGYPKIAHVIMADLPLLGQCRPGDWVTFKEVSLAQAQRIQLEFEQGMRVLAAAIAMRKMEGVQ
ncbi:biotin-dependent carboxyltransferase family protein [Paenibacillus lycopersici]|uniref:Biotin-dependent carboxyltransferase family protein n=1 Tax=Paenibacillus lycopersici TaxID=2704462 RepID=A0A6C0G8P6_9BACL|nr:biotin-dependent carboxyltransferase family protein [Paenibacillus lycopersici]QHT64099.1 biotin-dependent carboxyltransferase family protein [Paenibacillus lycopersici]